MAAPAPELDQGALHHIFLSYLGGPEIAACAQASTACGQSAPLSPPLCRTSGDCSLPCSQATRRPSPPPLTQVCRAWRAVAASEPLWQRKAAQLEPHEHLRRDDLLPEFGGSHRAYYAWRWRQLARPLGRILVEGDGGETPWPEVATYPAPASASGGAGGTLPAQLPAEPMDADAPGGSGGGSAAAWRARGAAAVPCAPQAVVQQPTLAPTGSLLAFTEMEGLRGGHLESRVVVADARSGRRVCTLALQRPFPPFYYCWSACGTRLLFLRRAGRGTQHQRPAACWPVPCSLGAAAATAAAVAKSKPCTCLLASFPHSEQQLGGRRGGAEGAGPGPCAAADTRPRPAAAPAGPGAAAGRRAPAVPGAQPHIHPPAVVSACRAHVLC